MECKFWDIIKKGDDRTVAVKKNILQSFFIRGISVLVSLLVVPITLNYVNSELYGVWLTLSSIIVWMSFFDVGLNLGLKNRLAEVLAFGDVRKGRQLVSTTYFLMILVFLPLCFILELIIPSINWGEILNVSDDYRKELENTLGIIVICVGLQMIVNVLTAVVAAYQKVALSGFFLVLGNLVSLIAIIFIPNICPPSLVVLALIFSGIPVVVMTICSFYMYHETKIKEVAPSWEFINLRLVKDLFGLGGKFFIIQVQVIVMFQSTNLLISYVSGPNDVTYYNIVHKYIGVAMMLFSILIGPLWPAFTDAFVKNDYKWMENVYNKLIKAYAVTVMLVIIMVCISQYIYDIWVGGSIDIPFKMTIFVSIYMLIYNWDNFQIQLINGVGKIELQTYVTILGLIFHIPLSLLLGRYFGSYGVIISMIIINTIYSVFFTKQINLIIRNQATGIWFK